MKPKTLHLISFSVALTFIIILIILWIADLIKVLGLIIYVVIILTLIIGGDLLFTLRKSSKNSTINIDNKITRDEAIKIHKDALMDLRYLEYEDDIYLDEVRDMGISNTPIYFRLVRGLFDRRLYGTVRNLIDPTLGGMKEYDDTKISMRNIESDMEYRANKSSLQPRPEVQHQTEELINELTGSRIYRNIPISQNTNIENKEEKGVDLS